MHDREGLVSVRQTFSPCRLTQDPLSPCTAPAHTLSLHQDLHGRLFFQTHPYWIKPHISSCQRKGHLRMFTRTAGTMAKSKPRASTGALVLQDDIISFLPQKVSFAHQQAQITFKMPRFICRHFRMYSIMAFGKLHFNVNNQLM